MNRKRVATIFITFLSIISLMNTNTFTIVADECPVEGFHIWSDWEEDYEPTCAKDGKESRYCFACDREETRKIPKLGHDWTRWSFLRKATPYKTGKKERECETCYKIQRRTIPKRKFTKDEKKAKKVIEQYLKNAKKYNVIKLQKYFYKKDSSNYFLYDNKAIQLLKKYNKNISWKFKSVLGKKKIVFTVKVKMPNLYKPAYDAVYKACKAYGDGIVSDNNFKGYFMKEYLSRLATAKVKKKTKTITFNMIKKGGKWKIKKQSREIVDIAVGQLHRGLYDGGWSGAWYIYLSK